MTELPVPMNSSELSLVFTLAGILMDMIEDNPDAKSEILGSEGIPPEVFETTLMKLRLLRLIASTVEQPADDPDCDLAKMEPEGHA